jgi:hypothetical protein
VTIRTSVTITKTLAIVAGEASPRVFDTIEYEGKLWFLPYWIEGQIPGTVKPLRIICLGGLPTGEPYFGQGYPEHDRVLVMRLGKETLEGTITQGLVVVERPDVIRLLHSTLIPGKTQ